MRHLRARLWLGDRVRDLKSRLPRRPAPITAEDPREEAVPKSGKPKRGRPPGPNPVASKASAAEFLAFDRPNEEERRLLLGAAQLAKDTSDLFEFEAQAIAAKRKAVRALRTAARAVENANKACKRELDARQKIYPEETFWLESEQLGVLMVTRRQISRFGDDFAESVDSHEGRKQLAPRGQNVFTQTPEKRLADQVFRIALNAQLRVPTARLLSALAILVGMQRPKTDVDEQLKQINGWDFRLVELRRDPEFSRALGQTNSPEKMADK